jgi:hypothetical protein
MTDIIKNYFKEKKIGIFTNSFNPELLKMSMDCYKEIEIDPIVIHGIKRGKSFYGYRVFNRVLSSWTIRRKYDYLIYVDEDCFISEPHELYKLMKYFIENDYDFCGMPDGGVVGIRGHNPVSINTFFTIFNVKNIKKIYRSRRAKSTVYTKELDKFIPHHLIKKDSSDVVVSYDKFEPYYKIFFYLLSKGARPLYLDAKVSELDSSGIATALMNHLSNVFCHHTWYAREYNADIENKARIDSVYRAVKTSK